MFHTQIWKYLQATGDSKQLVVFREYELEILLLRVSWKISK